MKTAQSISNKLIRCFKFGCRCFIIGNGGSATMASHFSGELQGKFKYLRQALPAVTLFDLATITAIANDFGYKYIFSRQLDAQANPGDFLIVLSTSGKSKNCLEAIKFARRIDMEVIEWPRKGKDVSEIQENQLKLIHKVCGLVEEAFI